MAKYRHDEERQREDVMFDEIHFKSDPPASDNQTHVNQIVIPFRFVKVDKK